MFNRILIAYDGSPESQRALATGIQLAVELHSDTTLVTVVEPLPSYVNMASAVAPEVPSELRHERRDRMEKLQQEVKQQATIKNVPVETLLVEGEEIEGILGAAKQTHADLLVVGLHRHHTAIEFAGTLRRIANHTLCPILAVA